MLGAGKNILKDVNQSDPVSAREGVLNVRGWGTHEGAANELRWKFGDTRCFCGPSVNTPYLVAGHELIPHVQLCMHGGDSLTYVKY